MRILGFYELQGKLGKLTGASEPEVRAATKRVLLRNKRISAALAESSSGEPVWRPGDDSRNTSVPAELSVLLRLRQRILALRLRQRTHLIVFRHLNTTLLVVYTNFADRRSSYRNPWPERS